MEGCAGCIRIFQQRYFIPCICLGGAPTIAMLIIQAQTQDPTIIYNAFIGLSVIIACIFSSIDSDSKCCFSRKNEQLEQKIKPFLPSVWF